MPFAHLPDSQCYYRLTGPDHAPVVILSHSLGQDHGMWDPQVDALAQHCRVLRYDIRGHGASTVSSGDYSVEQLAYDVLALADVLAIERFAFCGLSLGGMIGVWLATHAADRVARLVLANTSALPGAERMEVRRRTVLDGGMAAVADSVMSRYFSPEALAGNPAHVATARRVLLATDPVGYAGCCAAVRDVDLTSTLRSIEVPTLIISGERDMSLPWSGHGDVLAREIEDAEVVHLPTAHLSNLEAPRSFAAAVLDFVQSPGDDTAREGMKVRRAVLGDVHVDRAIATTTPLTKDFQELITRYAWGAIWTRPGLDVRTRRLLVLAITAAMGRWEEFRLHVRTGIRRDLEPCDLKEMLLQVAIYAGVPAANTGFQAALEEGASDHRDA